MRQAILVPAITLMVSWLSLATPLSCHHGATALFQVIQHADHDHQHKHHLVEERQVLLLPARVAIYVHGLGVNSATLSPGSEAERKTRSRVTSPEASDDLVTVRQIPDSALVFPILTPALGIGPGWHVYDLEPKPTTWLGPGLDPPPRYMV